MIESLPIRSETIKDNPKYVVHGPFGRVFSVHTSEYDARHNARVINGLYLEIDWNVDEREIWEAELYGQ